MERYILTLASVLINQEYGLYHLKQWSYFSLANYCCSAETQQLSGVLVPPPSNCKVNPCDQRQLKHPALLLGCVAVSTAGYRSSV